MKVCLPPETLPLPYPILELSLPNLFLLPASPCRMSKFGSLPIKKQEDRWILEALPSAPNRCLNMSHGLANWHMTKNPLLLLLSLGLKATKPFKQALHNILLVGGKEEEKHFPFLPVPVSLVTSQIDLLRD